MPSQLPGAADPEEPPVPASPELTRGAALASALAALDGLAALGETIEDEWTYVTALADAGRARIRAAARDDPAVPLGLERAVAVATACAEVGRIEDPHRAIDWLSMFPAIVELALDDGGAADPGA